MFMTIFFFFHAIDNDGYITNKQRDIIIDLIRQEKISKRSVKASSNIEIDKNAYIGRKPLELEVCFKKGFHNPICAKLFENLLISEKEKIESKKFLLAIEKQTENDLVQNYNNMLDEMRNEKHIEKGVR